MIDIADQIVLLVAFEAKAHHNDNTGHPLRHLKVEIWQFLLDNIDEMIALRLAHAHGVNT